VEAAIGVSSKLPRKITKIRRFASRARSLLVDRYTGEDSRKLPEGNKTYLYPHSPSTRIPPSQQVYILNPHIPNFSSTCSCAIKHFNHGAFAAIAGT